MTNVFHGVIRRKVAFISICNSEWKVKALRRDLSSEFVDSDVTFNIVTTLPVVGSGSIAVVLGQSSDSAFDDVLADSAMQFGTRPFHFDIYDTIQHSVNFFHHHWKLLGFEKISGRQQQQQSQ